MNDKQMYVAFITPQLKEEFDSLKEGKFEDKKLYEFIDDKHNFSKGIK